MKKIICSLVIIFIIVVVLGNNYFHNSVYSKEEIRKINNEIRSNYTETSDISEQINPISDNLIDENESTDDSIGKSSTFKTTN
ncbi:MAG: hypothetical protein ACOWWH_11270 [Eubacteriaceae bacterium]